MPLFGIYLKHRAVHIVDDLYVVENEKLILRPEVAGISKARGLQKLLGFFSDRARAFFVKLVFVDVVNVADDDDRNVRGEWIQKRRLHVGL